MESLATAYNMTVEEADCLECFGAIAARCLRLAKQIPLVSELVPDTNCVASTDDSDWQLTGVFIVLTLQALWFVVYTHSKTKAPTASASASEGEDAEDADCYSDEAEAYVTEL